MLNQSDVKVVTGNMVRAGEQDVLRAEPSGGRRAPQQWNRFYSPVFKVPPPARCLRVCVSVLGLGLHEEKR